MQDFDFYLKRLPHQGLLATATLESSLAIEGRSLNLSLELDRRDVIRKVGFSTTLDQIDAAITSLALDLSIGHSIDILLSSSKLAGLHQQIEKISGINRRVYWVFLGLKKAYDDYRGVLHLSSLEQYICPCFKVPQSKVQSLLLLNSFVTTNDLKKDLGLGEACSYCLKAVEYLRERQSFIQVTHISKENLADAKRNYLKKFGKLPRYQFKTPFQAKKELLALVRERMDGVTFDLEIFDQRIYLNPLGPIKTEEQQQIVDCIAKIIPEAQGVFWLRLD